MGYKAIRWLLLPVIKLIWVRRVEGLENIPKGGAAIIASNHESYFDFLCFSAICPRPVVYLAGEVFFKKWYWRPLMKLTGQIRVDRDSKDKSASVTAALETLKAGQLFGIFPEGTRSKDGKLQKAFTGVAKIALTARVPVIPVGMVGTYEIMSRHDKFPKFRKCRIQIGQPLDLSRYYGLIDNKEILEKITHKIIMPQIAKLTNEDYDF